MKPKNKKGFTIVELVIVIAVIGILAAILIPTFINLNSKARVANTTSFLKNVNTQLAMKEAHHDLDDFIGDYDSQGRFNTNVSAKDYARVKLGYDFDLISPFDGNEICWDKNNKKFGLVDYSDENNPVDIYAEESKVDHKWQRLSNDPQQTKTIITNGDPLTIKNNFSKDDLTSLGGDIYDPATETLIVSGTTELGDNPNVKNLEYKNLDAAQDDEVIIQTNSANVNLTVKGYVDPGDSTKGDAVEHYGNAGSLNIVSVATGSYHENGNIAYAEISKGRIVLEEGSSVEEIHINKKTESTFDEVVITNNGGNETLPERITRDTVTVESETLVVKVESNGSSEEVYVYANGATGTTEKVTEGENKQNEAVNSALGQLVLDNGSAGEKAQTQEEKEETKTSVVETAKSDEEAQKLEDVTFWEQCVQDVSFYDGKGTEADPYLISSAKQLALVAHNINNSVELTQEEVANGNQEYYGAYYKLIANVNISKLAWTPIGASSSKPFAGHIDGNNKNIIGMTNGAYRGEVSENEYTHHIGETYGFIAFTKDDVSVKNLTIKDISVNYDNAKVCGGLIGYTKPASGSTTSLTISGVKVDGYMKGYDKVAGLVGYLLNVPELLVENCTVDGTLSLTNYTDSKVNKGYRAGGLFGYISIETSTSGLVKDCTVSANITKGDSTADYFWLGAITSGYNSKVNMTFTNFKFDGEINGHDLKGQVGKKSGSNVNESVYTGYLDLLDANNNPLFGNIGSVGEIWWCHTAHDTRIKDPEAVVNAIIGENRDYEYHLSAPTPSEEGGYSFVMSGESCITNFNMGSNHVLHMDGGNVEVDYETGNITKDTNNLVKSGHTAISEDYTYYDLLLEVLQNHFIHEVI